jgi:hypothetical protein
MELATVQNVLTLAPKGANIVLEWTRSVKTRKGVTDTILKSVRMVGRVGIEYDNQKSVIEKRESGELPSENQGLPWGRWEVYPYLIEHNGKRYVRLYNGTSKTVKPQATFTINGEIVKRDEIADKLLASELAEKSGDCFTCKVEDMTRIWVESDQ